MNVHAHLNWLDSPQGDACGSCRHFSLDKAKDAMPAFGICDLLPAYQRVSIWPWGCRLNPSRFEAVVTAERVK